MLSDVQGRGLGRRLTTEWARRAVARGFHAAIARVLAGNPACHFYERLGARPGQGGNAGPWRASLPGSMVRMGRPPRAGGLTFVLLLTSGLWTRHCVPES